MSANIARNSFQKKELKRKLFGSRKVVPCCFCHKPLTFDMATLEHVKPLSMGGGWEKENLRISCPKCNGDRGTIDFVEFRKRFKILHAPQKDVDGVT